MKNNKNSQTENHIKYTEKSIIKDVILYNENFQATYPLKKYKEPKLYNYDVLVGLPINYNPDELKFRVEIFRNIRFIDKSNNFSYFNGVIYNHYDLNKEKLSNSKEYGSKVYKKQIIGAVPFGIKFQTNSKRIIPFVYLSAGASLYVESFIKIKNYKIIGETTNYHFLPIFNIGLGTKIRLKSNYIIAEITPTFHGLFFNVGYSF